MYYNDNKSNTFVSFLSLDFSARTVQKLDTLTTEFMHVASGFILVRLDGYITLKTRLIM